MTMIRVLHHETHGIRAEYRESASEVKVKMKTAARMVGLKKCESRYVVWTRRTVVLKGMAQVGEIKGFWNEACSARLSVSLCGGKMTYYAVPASSLPRRHL
jgi:hypothetical protein